ncbi:peptidase M28 family protein [Pelomyxa schiedti]|nr:peptidase M28 family protein [Pelomyxa schiedti]
MPHKSFAGPGSTVMAVGVLLGLVVLCGLGIIASLVGGSGGAQSDSEMTQLDILVNSILSDNVQFSRLCELCDLYPARVCSSSNMDAAVEWCLSEMKKEGMTGYTENVTVPNWYHNPSGDSLRLLSPGMPRSLAVTALGLSIGTDPAGIEAEALVVSNFEELQNRSSEAAGKIIVYDVPYVSYNALYRIEGAVRAAAVGGIASLTMSLAPASLYTLHTGSSTTTSIPAGSITVEDASMLHRMQLRGQVPRLKLVLNCSMSGTTISHNTILDIPGTEFPNEVVIISGHLDSWMSGAHDDAAAIAAAWQVVRSMHLAGIRARRTIRLVMWTCEEFGGQGGQSYAVTHAGELGNTSLALEMDHGMLPLDYFRFSGPQEAFDMLAPTMKILADYGINITLVPGGGCLDTQALEQQGVPAMAVVTQGYYDPYSEYWDLHHSYADTPDKLSYEYFTTCSVAVAVMAFNVANLDTVLPHKQPVL